MQHTRGTRRRAAIWLFAAVLVLITVWCGSVAVRVVSIKKRNLRIMNSALRAHTPPETPAPAFAPPDTQGVDWQALDPHLDAEGVFIFDYDASGQRGVSGKQRNPYNISAFAIHEARAYLETGDEDDLRRALRQFDYLRREAVHVVIDGDSAALWQAGFDLGYQYNAKAPWRSAYFQVRCVDAMLWAAYLTGDDSFSELAERGLSALGHPVSEGGLSYVTDGGGLFFEEVVTTPLHHILNGNMSVLISVYHYYRYTGSQRAKEIFDRGVRGTLELLPRYDRYAYSLYSLSPNPRIGNHFNIANSNYHHLHVAQLETLYDITGNETFREYAKKWRRRANGPFDVAWTAVWIAFKDGMKLKKVL